MRTQTNATLPALQPCCGKHHLLPFQHVRVYQDNHSRTKHWYECARCYKTRHLENRRVRWQSSPGSRYCDHCEKEIDAEIEALSQARMAEHIRPKGWF